MLHPFPTNDSSLPTTNGRFPQHRLFDVGPNDSYYRGPDEVPRTNPSAGSRMPEHPLRSLNRSLSGNNLRAMGVQGILAHASTPDLQSTLNAPISLAPPSPNAKSTLLAAGFTQASAEDGSDASLSPRSATRGHSSDGFPPRSVVKIRTYQPTPPTITTTSARSSPASDGRPSPSQSSVSTEVNTLRGLESPSYDERFDVSPELRHNLPALSESGSSSESSPETSPRLRIASMNPPRFEDSRKGPEAYNRSTTPSEIDDQDAVIVSPLPSLQKGTYRIVNVDGDLNLDLSGREAAPVLAKPERKSNEQKWILTPTDNSGRNFHIQSAEDKKYVSIQAGVHPGVKIITSDNRVSWHIIPSASTPGAYCAYWPGSNQGFCLAMKHSSRARNAFRNMFADRVHDEYVELHPISSEPRGEWKFVLDQSPFSPFV